MSPARTAPDCFSFEDISRKLRKLQSASKETSPGLDPSTSISSKNSELKYQEELKQQEESNTGADRKYNQNEQKQFKKDKLIKKYIKNRIPYPYPEDQSQVISTSFAFVFSIFKRNIKNMQKNIEQKKQNVSSNKTSRFDGKRVIQTKHIDIFSHIRAPSVSQYNPLDEFLLGNARYRFYMPEIVKKIRQLKFKCRKVRTYRMDRRAKLSEKPISWTEDQINDYRLIKKRQMQSRMIPYNE